MNDTRHFANVPASVRQARRFVAQFLAETAEHIARAATLMVSELAANCIRHATTGFSVTLQAATDVLRIEVADDGRGVPELRSPSASELSGRGLRIVAELSDDWGFSSSPEIGTSVWFSIRLDRDRDLANSGLLQGGGALARSRPLWLYVHG